MNPTRETRDPRAIAADIAALHLAEPLDEADEAELARIADELAALDANAIGDVMTALEALYRPEAARIVAAALADAEIVPGDELGADEPDCYYRVGLIGTTYLLAPSGRHLAPWAAPDTRDPRDLADTAYWMALEAAADEADAWIDSNPGDPTDVLVLANAEAPDEADEAEADA
jgi:hypothetical protein